MNTFNIERELCPVCHSENTEEVWKIPFSKLDQSIKAGSVSVNLYPMLNSQDIYRFCKCKECESVYLNPLRSMEGHGHKTEAYINKMKDERNWKGYNGRYKYFSKFIKEEYSVFLDAACAVGQYAQIAKKSRSWDDIICLEYSKSYVEYMKSIGLNAHQVDFHRDIIHDYVSKDSVDFIVFSEAFEHMKDALFVMNSLVSLLKSGGRIFFSAQALGGNLPVRPAETIYINTSGIDKLCQKTNTSVIDVNNRGDRFWITLEKE